jgi:hypothetical protein
MDFLQASNLLNDHIWPGDHYSTIQLHKKMFPNKNGVNAKKANKCAPVQSNYCTVKKALILLSSFATN